jgi:adenylate cyclase class 2
MALETEVKIQLESANLARELLSAGGFVPIGPREFESNQLFDTPDQRLRSAGELIRVRRIGDRRILTYKGRSLGSEHKVREELETAIGDAEMLEKILNRLGYAPTWRYEKYRTEFQRSGEAGHALLDETPIGVFLELEGDADWIDRAAVRLGFSKQDYILQSYAGLFAAFHQTHGLPLTPMIFLPHLDKTTLGS